MRILGLAGVVLAYAAFVWAWRWLLRRWGLTGPGAPERAALGQREYLARRSLRALLAFDFLIILPVMALAVVMAVATGAVTPPAAVFSLLFAPLVFVVPIWPLRRSIREAEARRAAGLPEKTEAEARSTGHAPLDAHLRTTARATRGVALVIVLVSVAAWLDRDGTLALLLRKDSGAILRGQVWRLFTVALVHAGVMYLLFNVSVLLNVGATFERLAGAGRMLLVLAAGTVAGAALSTLLDPRPSVGASGGVLAVAAALATFAYRHRAALPARARPAIVEATAQLVVMNAVLTFVLPNVDWAAHVGGLVVGAALGWFTEPSAETRRALSGAGSEATPG